MSHLIFFSEPKNTMNILSMIYKKCLRYNSLYTRLYCQDKHHFMTLKNYKDHNADQFKDDMLPATIL